MRIAHSLHDGLAQELSLAALESDLLRHSMDAEEAETANVVRRLHDRLRIAIDWVRNLAYELQPTEIDKVGLAAALASFCSEMNSKSPVNLSWEVDDDTGNLPTPKAINIYRIAQEAVTNAIRHSQATNVSLELRSGNRQLELVVRDDGIGINAVAHTHNGNRYGLGIEGMRQRSKMLGSDLQIASRSGGGTMVRLSIPISTTIE